MGAFFRLLPLLDSTKHLRQKAAAFVADQPNFSWRHRGLSRVPAKCGAPNIKHALNSYAVKRVNT